MPLVLVDLGTLVIALVALALCLLVVAFTKAFFGVAGNLLGKLPVVGGWLDAGAHKIEQRIANVFGGVAASVEGVVGAMWHAQARIIDKLGETLAKHAGLLATIASFVPGGTWISNLYREIQYARQLVHKLAHAITGIGHDVVIRTRVIERGIGSDVLPRIRSLDREVGRVVGRTIPGLRAADRTLTREIDNLWQWTRKHTLVAGTAAFAGAVAYALSKLGLSWIRCPNAQSFFKKRGCNAWNDLEGLLAAAVGVAASLSLVELATAEQEIVGDLTTVVRDFWQV